MRACDWSSPRIPDQASNDSTEGHRSSSVSYARLKKSESGIFHLLGNSRIAIFMFGFASCALHKLLHESFSLARVTVYQLVAKLVTK